MSSLILFPRQCGRGRRSLFWPAQLFLLLLLHLLTLVHSFNLLVKLLPDHGSWRDFARQPLLAKLRTTAAKVDADRLRAAQLSGRQHVLVADSTSTKAILSSPVSSLLLPISTSAEPSWSE